MAGMVVAIGAFYLSTLLAYPHPACDETTYASASVSLLQRGTVGLTIAAAGSPTGRDTNAIQFGRLYIGGLATAFQFGGLSLSVGRFFSWLGWAVASGLLWVVGRQNWGPKVGLAAALLFATSSKAFLTAHTTRPESWLAALTLGALWLIVQVTTDHKPRPLQAFFSGLLVLMLPNIHLLGFAVAVGFALAVGIEVGVKQRRWRTLLWIGLGMLAGAALWFAWTVGTDFDLFQQVGGVSLSPLASTTAGNRWLNNLASIAAWFYTIFWSAGGPLSLVEGLLAVFGLIWVWRQTAVAGRFIALIALGSLLAFALIIPTRWLHYGLIWSPFWWLLGVSGLVAYWNSIRSRLPTWVNSRGQILGWGLASLLVLANLAGDGWLLYRFKDNNYNQLASAIEQLVPVKSRVIADPVWWWQLQTERDYLTEDYVRLIQQIKLARVQSFLGISGTVSEVQAAEALLAKLQPDYVVLDEALSCSLDQGAEWLAYREVVQTQCRSIGSVTGSWATLTDPTKRALQAGQISTVYACGK